MGGKHRQSSDQLRMRVAVHQLELVAIEQRRQRIDDGSQPSEKGHSLFYRGYQFAPKMGNKNRESAYGQTKDQGR